MTQARYYVTGSVRDEYDPHAEGDTGLIVLCSSCFQALGREWAARERQQGRVNDGHIWHAGDVDNHDEPCARCFTTA